MKKTLLWTSVLLISGAWLQASPEPPPPPPDFPPREGRTDRRGPRPERRMLRKPWAELLEQGGFSPEEKARLQKLYAEDPRKAGEELHRLFRQRREAWIVRVEQLQKACRESTDEKEKARLKAELRRILAEESDRQLKISEEMLDNMARNLERMQKRQQEMRKNLEKRKQQKEAFVDQQLAEILSGAPVRRPPVKGPDRRP